MSNHGIVAIRCNRCEDQTSFAVDDATGTVREQVAAELERRGWMRNPHATLCRGCAADSRANSAGGTSDT